MATMKDISKETGLALATISKYLNGGNVRPENKILLDKAVEKYDFKINETARSLKTRKSKLIGIVIPDLANTFITTIITEMSVYFRQKGYGIMVTDCRNDVSLEQEVLEFMLSRQVDGLVHMSIGNTGEHLETCVARKIPVVLVDRKIDGFHFVGVDNVWAGKMATEHLIENGHKNIAIITGPTQLSTALERLTGYLSALQEHGILLNPSNILSADYSIESGYQRMKELLLKKSDITAVVVTNYEMTVGAMIAVNELSVKIPEDLSFVGFDNLLLSRVISPKITIVSQPVVDIATTTAELLLKKINKDDSVGSEILPPFLEKGKSVLKIN